MTIIYRYIYIEFIEINKHKKKLQIFIQQLMAANIIVDNGYLKINLISKYHEKMINYNTCITISTIITCTQCTII